MNSIGDNWGGELVAVDFDGTLTQGDARFWENETEEPREAIVEWTRQQYYDGKHVVVWTARPWSEASTIVARLTEWEVPYHGIRCEKGGADLYVDDKAVSPEDAVEDGECNHDRTEGPYEVGGEVVNEFCKDCGEEV